MNTLLELSRYMNKAQKSYEVCANNIANSNTGGFKRMLSVERTNMMGTYVDTTRGQLNDTGNQNDVALRDNKYFCIQTTKGVLFTRDGNFTVNEKNQLVTTAGNPVLGQKGPVFLKEGTVKFDADGNIYDGETKTDSLLIVEPTGKTKILNVGNNLFNFDSRAVSGKDSVLPGTLEGSNVDPMKEMTQLIIQIRNFDIAQKFVKMRDSLLGKISTEIGTSG